MRRRRLSLPGFSLPTQRTGYVGFSVRQDQSDVCVSHVWIYNSRLHLIDISHVSPPSRNPRRRQNFDDGDDEDGLMREDELEDYLAVEDAIEILRDPHTDTLAPPAVEKTVWSRISE